MEILTAILIIGIIIVLIASSFSKSSTSKGKLMDGVGSIARYGGGLVSGLREQLSASSIQSEVEKINLGFSFTSRYQRDGNVIFIRSDFEFKSYRIAELTERIKNNLVENGVKHDKGLVKAIESNRFFFNKCKSLGIGIVNVSGCMIYPFDSTEFIKESNVLKVFEVRQFGLCEIKR